MTNQDLINELRKLLEVEKYPSRRNHNIKTKIRVNDNDQNYICFNFVTNGCLAHIWTYGNCCEKLNLWIFEDRIEYQECLMGNVYSHLGDYEEYLKINNSLDFLSLVKESLAFVK
jgi:hypothetical protein